LGFIMELQILTKEDIARRSRWIDKIAQISGNFGLDSERLEKTLSSEINIEGMASLLAHLRLCGAIPERYEHDSVEEKLYSKYTDIVISKAFDAVGCRAFVLKERANAADVECFCDSYSFVADSKAFRLSRTAKNQKDFKVQALDNWKHGKPFAMLVCPVYQLPAHASQIYQQATTRAVCIFTYTHLAVLVRYGNEAGDSKASALLYQIFQTVRAMNPVRDASLYWQTINRVLLSAADKIGELWREEKIASVESIYVARNESLAFLASERERIMKLSREEAIEEVLRLRKIENKIRAIHSVNDNGLLDLT